MNPLNDKIVADYQADTVSTAFDTSRTRRTRALSTWG
jgi:hypothetical protein